MDSLIAAAARALSAGDVLGGLKHVALRDDPPALALRGIAMAQLGDHGRARDLLRRAARDFGTREVVARARCIVAEAEVALAMRDVGGSPRPLAAATAALESRGDRANAFRGRLVAVRRLVLLGRLAEAAQALAGLDASQGPPALAALADLCHAELALRSLRTADAEAALARAHEAARRAGVPALLAEVEDTRSALERPAARCRIDGVDRVLRLHDVVALRVSGHLVVDACRRGLRFGDSALSLARRPILFALVHELASAWPGDVDRQALIAHAFRIRRPDETHRARLRVELGRLRALVSGFAAITATARGYALEPHVGRAVVVLEPPIEGEAAALVALLSDGAAWSTSALSLALGDSQRTIQRALVELQAAGRVRSIGRARSQRWLAPAIAGFTTILLLPAALSPE